jgi:hypothetical protein
MTVVPKEQDVLGEYPRLRQHWVVDDEVLVTSMLRGVDINV